MAVGSQYSIADECFPLHANISRLSEHVNDIRRKVGGD